MKEEDLAELIELIGKRDKLALEKLINISSDIVLKSIKYVLKESHEKEYILECYDDVIMKIIKKCNTYEFKCSFKIWIATIAKNTALDYKRKLKKFYEEKELIENANLKSVSAEDEVIHKESFKELNLIINKLNDSEKKLFINKYMLDKSTEELTKIYSISKNTLYKRLSRLKGTILKLSKEQKGDC